MKRGTLSLRHGHGQQRRKKTYLGARRQRRKKTHLGTRRRYSRKGLGGGGNAAGNVSGGAAWASRSRTNTRAGQKRRPIAPNRARIWRANEKEPDLLQFSPGSRNRAKVSTALSRHYTEGPDGYTRRVFLKLQQIAIRCIRQRDPAARQSETSTRQHGAGACQRAAGRLLA